jgi:hypothetical protein
VERSRDRLGNRHPQLVIIITEGKGRKLSRTRDDEADGGWRIQRRRL